MDEGKIEATINLLVQNLEAWRADRKPDYRQLEILYWLLKGQSLAQIAPKVESNTSTINLQKISLNGMFKGAQIPIDEEANAAAILRYIERTYGDETGIRNARLPVLPSNTPPGQPASPPPQSSPIPQPARRNTALWTGGLIVVLAAAMLIVCGTAYVLYEIIRGGGLPTTVPEEVEALTRGDATSSMIEDDMDEAIAGTLTAQPTEVVPEVDSQATIDAAVAGTTIVQPATEVVALPPTATRTPKPTNTPSPTRTPVPPIALPFGDSFASGPNSSWIIEQGNFTVVEGWLRSLDGDYKMKLPGTLPENYSVTYDVEDAYGGSDISVVLGGATKVDVGGWGWALSTPDGNRWRQVAGGFEDYECRVRIEVRGNHYTVYFNGEYVSDIVVGNPSPEGITIALETRNGVANFQITSP